MADLKLKYGTSVVVTCTLANLPTATAWQSTAMDNSGLLAVDASLYMRIGLMTGGTTGNENMVHIYFYGSQDKTKFSDDVSGVDAAFAIKTTHNLRGPFSLNFQGATAAPAFCAVIPSVASYFGGVLPVYWGVVVHNRTNTKLATGTTMTASYTPIYLQSV